MIVGIFSSLKLEAQDDGYNSQGRFGIRAGVTVSKQTYEGGNLSEDPKSKFGADFAAIFNIPIGDGFLMLQPELHWMQKGSVIEDINGDDITNTLNYLELPLLLRLNFGGSAKIFALGGPSIGYFLGGKSGGEDIEKSLYEDTEWGVHVGVGVGMGAIEIDLRYMAGLSDISAANGNADEIKNSAFGAGVTLKF
jgi:Outer membrane protein beta-barrel domain